MAGIPDNSLFDTVIAPLGGLVNGSDAGSLIDTVTNLLGDVVNDSDDEQKHFVALLEPANNSGAHGVGLLTLGQNTLTVDVAASGLTPNRPHPFHIHGFADDRPSQLPTIAQDTDRDGFVESSEGSVVFGPVIFAMGEDSPPAQELALNAFPTADAAGNIDFRRVFTFDLNNSQQSAIFGELSDRLAGRGLQFHGENVPSGSGAGTGNEVNGSDGYVAGVPVTNGIIRELPGGIVSNLASNLGSMLPDLNKAIFG
ncbi:hypothetical protein [Azospirillum canadense]|uniref:hypothetical protein n=1 Tax=Azospirillum canadense TaxID=403962 RepID=UPI0022280497|nr:hypothetical protein [Azospirillum canadense]MCW2243558.1 hypothetical protein [Azospirillum canadense]